MADFQPSEGDLRVYRRSVAPNRYTPPSGHYSILNRKLAVLYREGNSLKFFLEEVGVTTLTDDVTASWQLVTKNKAQLSLDTDPPIQVIYRSDYNRVVSHIAAAPSTTREDLDFGLYVSNVLKNQDRRADLYRPKPDDEE
ncbi:MAG TPA: hypothetical protein VLL08_00210 [Kineosporiaceae bacterium]|nr:hypothetical protein [Kineosporiaceae bacterium]